VIQLILALVAIFVCYWCGWAVVVAGSIEDFMYILFNVLLFLFPFSVISRSSVLFDMLGYISTSINDGPGCLMLRCPDPTCGAAVGQDMITLLKSDEDKQKYARYLLRSYIEDNKKVCPRYGIMKLIK